MNHKIRSVLFIIFIICLFPLNVLAADNSRDLYGSTDLVSWALHEDGTLSLSGKITEPDALCVAAVYDADDRMITVRSSDLPAEGESTTFVLLEGELPANYYLKLFFTDRNRSPRREAATWRINLVEPTCTRDGYTFVAGPDGSRKCALTSALGHSWGEGTVIREPEGVVPGELTHTCTRCGTDVTAPVYP